MASPSLFLLVCVAGISFVLVEAQTCSTVGETFCKSCSNLVLCDANLNELNIPCPTGQVCGNGTASGDSSGCYILTSTPTNNFALCACTTTPGYLADPFDPSKYQVCIATGIQVEASCPPGEVFDGSGCAVGPTMAPTTAPPTLDCTDKTPGFQTLPPACTSYYACLQDPSNPSQLTPYGPYTCPNAGDVFTGSVCVAESDLLTGIEPYMCTGTETGAFLDTVECNAFHICMGTTEIGVKQCCPPGMRFDGSLMNCVDAANVPDSDCPNVDCIDPALLSYNCTESLATTPSTSSLSSLSSSSSSSVSSGSSSLASSTSGSLSSSSMLSSSSLSSTSSINPSSASVTTQSTTTTGGVPDCSTTNGAVPYPGDCTKYYWCSNGRYTLQFCPPKLLFDSTNGYCDLPENVSGC